MDKQLAIRHVMQANRSRDTGPELLVRAGLRAAGLAGYRLHWKKAPGRPDVCYPGRKVAIFVHGCYWHRCPRCALPMPKSNVAFWEAKFGRNVERDRRCRDALAELGWTVLVVWECRLKGERLATTMAGLAREVGRAQGAAGAPGRIIEVGLPRAWKLRLARRRLSGRARRR